MSKLNESQILISEIYNKNDVFTISKEFNKKYKRQFTYDKNLEKKLCEKKESTVINNKNINNKQLRKLKNKISAQRSRDNTKTYIKKLEFKNDNLSNEIDNLKNELKVKNNNSICTSCGNKILINKSNITDISTDTSSSNFLNNSSNLSNNNFLNSSNTFSNDNNSYNCLNFSNSILKIGTGMLIGIIVVIAIINSNFNNGSNKLNLAHNTKRNLYEKNNNITNTDINNNLPQVVVNKTKSISTIPVSLNNILSNKRNKFIYHLSKKLAYKDYNNETKNNYENKCIDESIIDYYDIDKKNNNKLDKSFKGIVPFLNLNNEIKIKEEINKSISSLILNDDTLIKGNMMNLNKIYENDNIKNEENNCFYLHIIIPSSVFKMNNYSFASKGNSFWEVGCKIFALNKIFE